MASSRPALKPLDLDITVVSAKHLKNVNWRIGDLKPYAVFWLDPDSRVATKPDDTGSTRPVWNERFTLPITAPLHDSLLTLELLHSKPSETPKPLVGTLTFPLNDLVDSQTDSKPVIRSLELRRPSGRPQGKIRLKLAIRERPMPPPPPSPPIVTDYQFPPPQTSYYGSVPPPPLPNPIRDYNDYSHPPPYAPHPPPPLPPFSSPYSYGNYSDPYSYGGYGSGYYQRPAPPPRPLQPFFDRPGYGFPGGPSAPIDYSAYDQKQKGGGGGGGKMGLGTGLAVGAVAGALGGLALEEGVKYEEEKIAERVESDAASGREGYGSYRGNY